MDAIQNQLAQLNRLYQEGNDLYYKTASALGLSDSALMILYGLCRIGKPCTQKELCEAFYLKKQTLHSALGNLLKMGIVITELSPVNTRIKLIILTQKGKLLCERTAIPFLQGELAAFSRLSAEERNTLLTLTRKHKAYILEEASKLMNNFEEQID